jgi:hypothetical protein
METVVETLRQCRNIRYRSYRDSRRLCCVSFRAIKVKHYRPNGQGLGRRRSAGRGRPDEFALAPDGERVANARTVQGNYDVWLTEVGRWVGPRLVARRALLLYAQGDPKTLGDLWALPLNGDAKPFPVVQTAFDETMRCDRSSPSTSSMTSARPPLDSSRP